MKKWLHIYIIIKFSKLELKSFFLTHGAKKANFPPCSKGGVCTFLASFWKIYYTVQNELTLRKFFFNMNLRSNLINTN